MNAKLLLILPMVIAVSLYASSPAENSLIPAKNQAQKIQPVTVALRQQAIEQKSKADSPKTQTTTAKIEPQQKPQNSPGLRSQSEEGPGLRSQSKEGYSRLNATVNASAFKADMTFERAIDALRNSTKPPLQIVVLWRQLEQAGVNPYTPVKTDAFNGLSVMNNLNILLTSVSAGRSKLAWSERDNIIVIGLKQSNGDKKTCLYNVCDLASAPSNAVAMSPYGFNQAGNTGFNNTAGGNRLQTSAFGGVSNFNTPIATMNSGVSLGVGGGGFGGAFGGMGMGGMGFGGGMGFNSPIDTPLQQQIRQQQLKTLLQSTVSPGTWQ